MKNYLNKVPHQPTKMLMLFALVILLFSSCQSDYIYDKKEPNWLGSSIYDYLQKDGHYTNFVRLIDDLNYAEVLKLTGSKTLFVANDSSFTEFYKNNPWGVSSYDQLTLAQKKSILKYAMVNNAYVVSMFSNYYSSNVLYEGTAMRRMSALADIDSIPFERPENMPAGAYWDAYRTKGMYLLKDYTLDATNNALPMVFFTQTFMDKNSISDDDFSILTGGKTRNKGDMYIFDNKVVKQDIVCKNGYIHVLDKVMIPPTNMADYISKNVNTKIFSKLLDRFSAPFYDPANTLLYKQLNPTFNDSIFAKCYFASFGGKTTLPSGLPAKNLLTYSPGWNSYRSTALQSDMAAMFVPSDQAMNDYFNSGVGAILKSRFGSWDNVPDEIVLPFIKRHMRGSLIESVPSKFYKMVDEQNYRLPVDKGDIVKTYTGVNGEVYITNKVYPPVDYISVYSPVLLSGNTKIMNWAINISETNSGTTFAFYRLYLNSLVSNYSLFIPTDEYFSKYVDPIAYGQDVPGVLKFWFNDKTQAVNATVYKYDVATKTVGDSVDLITSATFLKNRLWDFLDSHIVVGDVESGSQYYVTKGNDIIKVNGTGTSMTVQGGGDITDNTVSNVTNVFRQSNGSTYFIDKPIQPALQSAYKVLSETPEFSEFFNLLNGVPDTCVNQIFSQQGIDYRVNFFNAFRYTIYVPTNQAIQTAIANNVITPWESIYAMTDPVAKSAAIQRMIRMLRYHFQDNAVFSNQVVNQSYLSSTIKNNNDTTLFGTAKNKYYKIGVVGDGNTLTLTMDSKKGQPVRTAHVTGLTNIIVKDYIFGSYTVGSVKNKYKNIDGTGSSTPGVLLFNQSLITSSASAVIHQIDNVLTFE
jgi:uncharacterized surface protein with fasciclin (FAS1) repeats